MTKLEGTSSANSQGAEEEKSFTPSANSSLSHDGLQLSLCSTPLKNDSGISNESHPDLNCSTSSEKTLSDTSKDALLFSQSLPSSISSDSGIAKDAVIHSQPSITSEKPDLRVSYGAAYNLRRNSKTPVTLLQELLLKRHVVPNFELIHNGVGTHQPTFKFQVSAIGKIAFGNGKSKKEAKHDAARNFLLILKSEDSELQHLVEESVVDEVRHPYAEIIKDNAVGSLQEFCSDKLLRMPVYALTRDEGLPHDKIFCISCSVSSFKTEGLAKTKKQAKQLAAQAMLEKLKDCLQEVPALEKNNELENINKLNALVIEKLKEKTHHRCTNTGQVGLQLGDLYNSLIQYTETKPSPALDKVKNLPEEFFWNVEKPSELFNEIVNELGLQENITWIETSHKTEYMVSIQIVGTSSSTWTFLGLQKDKESALREACVRGLYFLSVMSC
ncbi:uncharacterized protein LOC106668550 isoform X1 [Cimex lectularius]|nr:uncharacterized protein LOC106668550 isoform X1 [Cimex lectularius]